MRNKMSFELSYAEFIMPKRMSATKCWVFIGAFSLENGGVFSFQHSLKVGPQVMYDLEKQVLPKGQFLFWAPHF